MAFKIKKTFGGSVILNVYEVNLYGAFEGGYTLEEIQNGHENIYKSYYGRPGTLNAQQVENIDIHLLIVDNYIQWKRENKNENTIQN